jgi:preprotein translocase subunit SecA
MVVGQPIEHRLISKAIENAQKRVEGQNFDIRKHLLEYDDVMNRQRQVIYEQRKKVLKGEALWDDVEEMLEEMVEEMVPEYVDEKSHPEDWDLKGLDEEIFRHFTLKLNLAGTGGELVPEAIHERIVTEVKTLLRNKETEYGKPLMGYLMKVIMLQSIDTQWKENLLAMDHLKEGIGLRGYGQKDPVREYQKEGYDMFMDMIRRVKEDSVEKLCLVQIRREEEVQRIEAKQRQDYIMSRDTPATATIKREAAKVGRNDPCPCGSGKKYKKCCGG